MQSIYGLQPGFHRPLKSSERERHLLPPLPQDAVTFRGRGQRVVVLALAVGIGLPIVTACAGSNGSDLHSLKPMACSDFKPIAEEQVARDPQYPKGALCQLGPATVEPFFGIKGVLQIPFLAWDKDHFIQRVGLYQKNKSGTYEPIPLGLTADTRFTGESTNIRVQGNKAYLPGGDIIDGSTGIVYRFTPLGVVNALQCRISSATEWDRKLSEQQLYPGALCRLSVQKEKETVIFQFLFWDAQRQGFFTQKVAYQPDEEGRLIRKEVLPESKTPLYGDSMGLTVRDGLAYLPDGTMLEGKTGMLYRLEPIGQIHVGD